VVYILGGYFSAARDSARKTAFSVISGSIIASDHDKLRPLNLPGVMLAHESAVPIGCKSSRRSIRSPGGTAFHGRSAPGLQAIRKDGAVPDKDWTVR
jgi:hypothetical protein